MHTEPSQAHLPAAVFVFLLSRIAREIAVLPATVRVVNQAVIHPGEPVDAARCPRRRVWDLKPPPGCLGGVSSAAKTPVHSCGNIASPDMFFSHGCTKSSFRIYSAYVTCGYSLSPSGVRGLDTAAACSPFSRLVSLGCAQGCGWASLDAARPALPA